MFKMKGYCFKSFNYKFLASYIIRLKINLAFHIMKNITPNHISHHFCRIKSNTQFFQYYFCHLIKSFVAITCNMGCEYHIGLGQ